MLRYPLLVLSLILLAVGANAILSSERDDLVTEPQLHPGWYDDYKVMKGIGDDGLDPEIIRSIRTEQRLHRGFRSGGNLTSILEMGPDNVGGRTRSLHVDYSDLNHIFAGSISGGLWESIDRGNTWTPVNDQEANLAVTSVVQSPINHNLWYYGTGEVRGNSAGIFGDGVYRSTDNGKTWKVLPSTQIPGLNGIWKVAVSPIDVQTVFIASQTGLYRSTDDGASFTKVSPTNAQATDIDILKNGEVLVCLRDEGIYKSPDGSLGSFSKLTGGLPTTDFNRIDMDYCRDYPNVMYAQFEHNSGDSLMNMYKSSDGGITWKVLTHPSTVPGLKYAFPWYCLVTAVAPNDSNFVLAGSQFFGFSKDGGNTWAECGPSHADYHAIHFDPHDDRIIWVGNDGGIYQYYGPAIDQNPADYNRSYRVTQFYAGAFFSDQNRVFGGTQDNGTQAGQIGDASFTHINGGDGAYCQISQQNSNRSYVSSQNGHIRTATNSTVSTPAFMPTLNELDGNGDGEVDEDAWFINPFFINMENGAQLYFPTLKSVWRTTNAAANWTPLTNDLSGNGRPYAVGVGYAQDPAIWIGGENSLFYRVDNAASASQGTEVNLGASVPSSVIGDFIHNITVHPYDSSVVYISLSDYKSQPRVWRVEDALSSSPNWVDISGDLPDFLPVNWVEVSPINDSVLFAATDFGLYSTLDGGTTWTQDLNIPNVPIHMLRLRHADGRLFIYTHGRGIWTGLIPGFISSVQAQPSVAIQVYPNPTADWLHVEAENRKVDRAMVYDIRGVQVMDERLSAARLNLGALQPGVYFVSLDSDGERLGTRRIVKE